MMKEYFMRESENPIRHFLGEKVFDLSPPLALVDTDPDVEKIDLVFVMPATAEILEY